jgi:hypothetical protein
MSQMTIPSYVFLLLSVFSPVLGLVNGFVLAHLTRRRNGVTRLNWDYGTYTRIVRFIEQRRDGARFEAMHMARRWDTVRSGTAAVVWAELDDLLVDLETERNTEEREAEGTSDDRPEDGSEASR